MQYICKIQPCQQHSDILTSYVAWSLPHSIYLTMQSICPNCQTYLSKFQNVFAQLWFSNNILTLWPPLQHSSCCHCLKTLPFKFSTSFNPPKFFLRYWSLRFCPNFTQPPLPLIVLTCVEPRRTADDSDGPRQFLQDALTCVLSTGYAFSFGK